MLSRISLVAAACLIAGCGFHLQNELQVPDAMERTYLDAVERDTQFHRELRRQLRASGVNIVESQEEATAIFTINRDVTGQRVLSVSARNVPTEYEVFYTVGYSLVSGEDSLLAPQDVTFTRDYTWDETLVLGKANEENMMREAIVRDLVRTVLKQLSTI